MALKFKNEAINKQKSKFTKSKTGKYKPVFTSFKFDRNTKYKGLCLREYFNGEKHFVVRFKLRGNRKSSRVTNLQPSCTKAAKKGAHSSER